MPRPDHPTRLPEVILRDYPLTTVYFALAAWVTLLIAILEAV